MPIYEFYCPDCHTIFSFFSAAVDTEARPDCPKCKRSALERKPSSFATLRHGGDEEPDPLERLGDRDLEGIFDSMAGELEGAGEEGEDPRLVASLFRRLGEATGLEPGPKLEEMLHRLEAGEDPELIEEQMGGELDDDEDSLSELFRVKRALSARRRRPRVDETLYFL